MFARRSRAQPVPEVQRDVSSTGRTGAMSAPLNPPLDLTRLRAEAAEVSILQRSPEVTRVCL